MTELHIYFHGLNLTLECEYEIDPGEPQSDDCPGADTAAEIGVIKHDGVLVSDPSDELVEALEEAAIERDGEE